MNDGRKRTATALATLCIAALGTSVLAASPTAAEPSIGDVQDRVDSLYHQAEQASERYNDARVELRKARHRLESLSSDLDRQRARVEQVRDQVAASVVQQYQGQALTTVSQVALAEDSDRFLSMLTTVDEYNQRQAAVVEDLAVAADGLEMREQVVQREVDTMARSRATLAKEKAEIDRRASEAEALLGRMESQRRERQANRSDTRTPVVSAAPASGRAAAAVQYALAQVGDAYVFGAAGPSAFDCSGLTMQAWAAAGASLPHSSSAQMGSGTPVSTSALQPGDLVFYYSPVSHVGVYIGNGMIVHAANPSAGVRVDPVGLMPISGAVRPG